MKSREKFEDEVFSSINGIKKAQAHPETYNRVMRSLTEARPAQATIFARPAVRWGLAFALVLLAAMNAFTIVSYRNASQSQSVASASTTAQATAQTGATALSSAFAEEYFSYLNNL
jgi:hypothetical protein